VHIRRLVSITVALMCVVEISAQETSRIPAGTASIAGRVTERESRRPLEGAIVQLTSPDGRQTLTALTGRDGQYVFEDIGAGKYSVVASLDGFASQRYGRSHPASARDEVIAVDAGEARRLLDLTLLRAGAIGGRVIDGQGRPLKDALVDAMFVDEPGSNRVESFGRKHRSNERGEYLVGNLPPGSYRILVQWTDPEMGKAKAGPYRPTVVLYPNVTRLTDATTVSLASGETVRGIDVVIDRPQRHLLNGHFVRGAASCPIEAHLLSKGQSIRSITVDPEGAFEIGYVDPGVYTIWARCRAEGTTEVALITLDIDSDVTDLMLPLLTAGRVTGRIVTADGGALPGGPLYLNALLAAGGQEIDPQPRDRVEVATDGSFDLSGVLGERSLAVTGLDPTWGIDRIRHGRSPVQSLTIQPSAELHDITVVLGRR
jgi:hypothetical protein